MTQDEVHAQIRRLASQRGGKLSMRAFFSETGVSDQWLRTQPWFAGWNDLMSRLGIEPQQFSNARIPLGELAKSVASLSVELGKWPTEDDIRRARRRDPSFPGLDAIRPFRRSGALAATVVAIADEQPALHAARSYAEPHLVREPAEVDEHTSARIQGYVYMIRSGRRYKIGKSTDPSRRFREVKLELPEEAHQIHAIPTDDPAGIEAYWHRRFAAKRVRSTEFFELSAEDVRAFRRRAYQ